MISGRETHKNLRSGPAEAIHPEAKEKLAVSLAAEAAAQQLSPTSAQNLVSANKENIPEPAAGLDLDASRPESNLDPHIPESNNVDEIRQGNHVINDENSFVNDIKARSPAKRMSRIEDSVEALDKIDDEIEKATEAIPAAEKEPPAKALHKVDNTTPKVNAKTKTAVEKKTGAKATSKEQNRKPVQSRGGSQPSKQVPTDRLVTKRASPNSSGGPTIRAATSRPPEVNKKVVLNKSAAPAKRVSSVHKAPFQPTKSQKPPTRASFELPGEAVARKLKEQREERLQREVEEKPKESVTKPRPARLSRAPEVKMTTAARARLSIVRPDLKGSNTPSRTKKTFPPTSGSSRAANGVNQRRVSSLSAPKHENALQKHQAAQPANKRVSTTASTGTAPSTAIKNRLSPTTENITQPKEKGKAVFARPKLELAERERARKEKEEAAKKARLEAAERGRIASRQWAKKQKAKKLAAAPSEKTEVQCP